MDIDNDTLDKLISELSRKFEVGSRIRIDQFFTDRVCSTDFNLDAMSIVINTSHFTFLFRLDESNIFNLNSFIGIFNVNSDRCYDLNRQRRSSINLLYFDMNNFIKSINGEIRFNGYTITLDEVLSSYLETIELLVMDESEVNLDLLQINDIYGG